MCLRSQGIDDDSGVVGGGRRARGLINNDRGVCGGSIRDDAPERTSLSAKAAVCLRSQIIDNNYSGVGSGRRVQGISDKNGGVGVRQG